MNIQHSENLACPVQRVDDRNLRKTYVRANLFIEIPILEAGSLKLTSPDISPACTLASCCRTEASSDLAGAALRVYGTTIEMISPIKVTGWSAQSLKNWCLKIHCLYLVPIHERSRWHIPSKVGILAMKMGSIHKKTCLT